MNSRLVALILAFLATSIYGVNHTIAKVIMPDYMSPFALVLTRVLGASIVFWILSFFIPNSTPIQRKDIPKIVLCILLGMYLNMLAFFTGLRFSTPINSSVIISFAPIMMFVFSVILLKEKITRRVILGLILAFVGVLLLLYNNYGGLEVKTSSKGTFLLIFNTISFALYFVLMKPLMDKYNVVHLLKWMFLGSLLLNGVTSYDDFLAVEWTELPFSILWRISFVVIGTTVLAYFFNMYALTKLRPTTIGIFGYTQPIVGIVYAMLMFNEPLSLFQAGTALLILVGVYLVSKRKSKPKEKRVD